MEGFESLQGVVVTLGVSAFMIATVEAIFRRTGRPSTIADWGNIGDFVAGFTGTLIGLITMLVVFLTYAATRKAMRDAPLASESAAASSQRAAEALSRLASDQRDAVERAEVMQLIHAIQERIDREVSRVRGRIMVPWPEFLGEKEQDLSIRALVVGLGGIQSGARAVR